MAGDLRVCFPTLARVFSRNVVLGGNCFCGERKCEKHPKKKQNFLLFGGGGGGGGGGEFKI